MQVGKFPLMKKFAALNLQIQGLYFIMQNVGLVNICILCDENTCLGLNQYATLDQRPLHGWFIFCSKLKRNSSIISKGNLNYPYFSIQLNFHGRDLANGKTY